MKQLWDALRLTRARDYLPTQAESPWGAPGALPLKDGTLKTPGETESYSLEHRFGNIPICATRIAAHLKPNSFKC